MHTAGPEVNQFLQDRKTAMQTIRDKLQEPQNRMKHFADQHRIERVLQVGDWVYLRLQPYKQTTLAMRRNLKLSPKFYGPYQIIGKIGNLLRSCTYLLAPPSIPSSMSPCSKRKPVLMWFHNRLCLQLINWVRCWVNQLPFLTGGWGTKQTEQLCKCWSNGSTCPLQRQLGMSMRP